MLCFVSGLSDSQALFDLKPFLLQHRNSMHLMATHSHAIDFIHSQSDCINLNAVMRVQAS